MCFLLDSLSVAILCAVFLLSTQDFIFHQFSSDFAKKYLHSVDHFWVKLVTLIRSLTLCCE
jgi:hypothetical protein